MCTSPLPASRRPAPRDPLGGEPEEQLAEERHGDPGEATPVGGDRQPLVARDHHWLSSGEERGEGEDEAGERLLGARALDRHADVRGVVEILERLWQLVAHRSWSPRP